MKAFTLQIQPKIIYADSIGLRDQRLRTGCQPVRRFIVFSVTSADMKLTLEKTSKFTYSEAFASRKSITRSLFTLGHLLPSSTKKNNP
jgi:hypothetical protein